MEIGDTYECIKYHEVGDIHIGDTVEVSKFNNDYVVINLHVMRNFGSLHVSQNSLGEYFKKV